jgi:DEAD/DEAH box helicase domain-containing protein
MTDDILADNHDAGASPISVEALLAQIERHMQADGQRQVVHVEALDAQQPRYKAPSPPLPPQLRHALDSLGIHALYTHQTEALEQARQGKHVVVVTPTSSGKTLCYNLPILETMLREREARALYIYPINALVNDQLKSLMKLNLALGREAVGLARYTGSLGSEQRRTVRARQPNLLLTNPEMLHLSFLLWHQNWETLWRNLRYIVVDEVHTYRGVFGSNMAHLFRRIQRMARHYGASPQFICCSATIANPGELAEALTGLPFSVVDNDGAGRGRRHFVLWNPPLLGDAQDNVRRSYTDESVDLMLECIRARYNTIVFARARSLTERMLRQSRGVIEEAGEGDLSERISSYRAGYLAEEREEIENKLKIGEMRGVITTNALELGIDIGGLDAAVIASYPGTVMSTWQQAGRAGRRGRDALILLVASQNPLDQYYVHHPHEFFSQPHELAVVDLRNQPILLKHLLCAARELPLSPAEMGTLPAADQRLLALLTERKLLAPCPEPELAESLTYPKARKDIHFLVSLRSASHETYRILDEKNHEIGTIEPPNVYREAHPSAIYQHAGDDYRVIGLDRHSKVVRVREENLPHYTRARSTLNLKIENTLTARTLDLAGLPFQVGIGEVLIMETVRSYQEMALGSDELIRAVNLTFPLVMRLNTTAMWVQLPPALQGMVLAQLPAPLATEQAAKADAEAQADANPYVDGLHALEHLLTGVLPLLVMCDRRDVDGYFDAPHPDLGSPAVFVYDAYEGGIGLAEVAYQRAEELLYLARDTVYRCQCATGCPSCIQSGVCRLHNESLDKLAVRTLMTSLIGRKDHATLGGAELLAQRQAAQAAPTSGDPGDLDLSQQRAIQELDERTARMGLTVNPAKEESATPTQQYAQGDKVTHTTYGQGTVVASRMDGSREMVTVRFVRRGMVRELDAAMGMLRKQG